MRNCRLEDCQKPRYQRSTLCSTHLMRLHRYGDFESRDRRGRIYLDSAGYVVQYGQRVHRAVLRAAIGGGEHPCHWCGMTVSWDKAYPLHLDGLVVDHLDGDKGNNDPSNLVPSCNRCNIQRRAA